MLNWLETKLETVNSHVTMRVLDARDRVYWKLYNDLDHNRDDFSTAFCNPGTVRLPLVASKCLQHMTVLCQDGGSFQAFAHGKTHRQRDQKSLLQSTIDVSGAGTSARIYTWNQILEFKFWAIFLGFQLYI